MVAPKLHGRSAFRERIWSADSSSVRLEPWQVNITHRCPWLRVQEWFQHSVEYKKTDGPDSERSGRKQTKLLREVWQ